MLDERPALAADLTALYGVDPYAQLRRDDSDGVRLLHALLERIPYEARSMHRATTRGGPEHFGFDVPEHVLQNLSDQVQGLHNMLAVKGTRKRAKAITRAWRPESQMKPQTLDEIDNSFFTTR